MTTFPDLQIPEAWKPLFRVMDDAGWELCEGMIDGLANDCRKVLRFEQAGLQCCLSFWEEAEWCGNNLQPRGLTVVGLSAEVPRAWEDVEPYSLLLTGIWEDEVDEFIAAFFRSGGAKMRVNELTTNAEQW